MNAGQKKKLEKARGFVEEAKEIIEQIAGEERDKFDAMSEGAQQGDRGQRIESAADALTSAGDSLDSVMEYIETAMEGQS